MKIAYGGGAIADYPWHLDGSVPWGQKDIFSAMDCLRALKPLGIRTVDTAYRYGAGISERLIGTTIGDDDFDIFTKIELGSIAEMKIRFSHSRDRLKNVNGILIHNPDFSKSFSLRQACRWLVEEWLEKGAVQWIGFSTEPTRDAEKYYREFGLNAIQFPYSELDRRADNEIFQWIKSELVMVNRVLGGPVRGGHSKAEAKERIEFIRYIDRPIDIAVIGTTNVEHLRECVEILGLPAAASNFGRME